MQLPPEITCASSTIADGNMSFRFGDEAEVVENRRNFLEQNSMSVNSYTPMSCTHGEVITLVDAKTAGVGAMSQSQQVVSEVLLTQEKNLALMVLTADCLPLCFYDPVTKTIALAHCSRVTTNLLLAQKTVSFLREELAVDPADLIVWSGPYIHKASYNFPAPLPEVHPNMKPFVSEENGVVYIDIAAANRHQLEAVGVPSAQIHFSDIDTVTSPEYFSHRESETTNAHAGRFATVLMLRD